MMKRKIVLQFISGTDEDNNYRYKKKTLRNIRPDADDDQLREFISRYCALTAYPLAEALIVDERVLVMEEEEELVVVISEEESDTAIVKKGEDVSKKGVTSALFQESEALLETPKAATPSVQVQELEKGGAIDSERIVPQKASKSRAKKDNLLLQTIPASRTSNQGSITAPISDEKLPGAKDKQRVNIKKHSPPLKADHEKVEPVGKNSLLTQQTAILEEEVIDASQADSVEALLELALKSERESFSVNNSPFIKDQPLPTLQFLTQEINRDLPIVSEIVSQSFIKPVKKKRMDPPLGKRTKPSKKKG